MLRWRFVPMGEAALLAEAVPAGPDANRAVHALAALLDAHATVGYEPSIPGINSLLLPFDPALHTHQSVAALLSDLTQQVGAADLPMSRLHRVPVRYGGEAGPDLGAVAEQLGLSPGEVVALHCGQLYTVLMIGFAPGFPYLGPLPKELQLPRRANPRPAVPRGSVAIAAEYSGIYPRRLPGGWHLIGNTDIALFDPRREPPATLQPGDQVRFEPVTDGVAP